MLRVPGQASQTREHYQEDGEFRLCTGWERAEHACTCRERAEHMYTCVHTWEETRTCVYMGRAEHMHR